MWYIRIQNWQNMVRRINTRKISKRSNEWCLCLNLLKKKYLHSTQVSTAVIKLSNFFAHHNVAFEIVEHLVPVLKKCFPDSKIVTDIKLDRNKTTKIIKMTDKIILSV